MGSEDQVMGLMLVIDQALHQAMTLEEKLDEYAQKLQVNKSSNTCKSLPHPF